MKRYVLGTIMGLCLVIASGLNIEIGIGKFLLIAVVLMAIAWSCFLALMEESK